MPLFSSASRCSTLRVRSTALVTAAAPSRALSRAQNDVSAALYANESTIGAALKSSGVPRANVFLISKLPPESMGGQATAAAFHATLEALQSEYLDLYLIHSPGRSRAVRIETWRAMLELHHSGACRAIGVANYEVHHLEEIESEFGMALLPHVNQCEYHPLYAHPSSISLSALSNARAPCPLPLPPAPAQISAAVCFAHAGLGY